MTVIDPRGMDVMEWTQRMALPLDIIGNPEQLMKPEEWREWAISISDTPTREGQNVPDPHQFDDWQEWAMRFNQVVELPG